MLLEMLDPFALSIIGPLERVATLRALPLAVDRRQVTPQRIADGLGAAQPKWRVVERIILFGHVFKCDLQPPFFKVVRAEGQILNR